MSGFCKVTITNGYVGTDAELKTTASGKQLCNWSVGTGKKGFTQWHNCQAWGDVAEQAAVLTKGNIIQAEGTINYNKYKDKIYTNITIFKLTIGATEKSKKVGDTVEINGETYEVVADAPAVAEKDEDLPF